MTSDKWEAARAVGDLLRAAREAAGLNKYQAADAARMSEGRWRQLERGVERKGGVDHPASTSPSTLLRIAEALDIEPERLLGAAGYSPEQVAELLAGNGSTLDATRRTGPVSTITVTGLSPEQVAIVEAFISGLRAGR